MCASSYVFTLNLLISRGLACVVTQDLLQSAFLKICIRKCLYKDVSKSSRTVLVKRSLLTLDVKFLITFKVLPFCTNTAVLAFLPCLEASLEVSFCNCVKYPLWFLLNLFNGVESLTLHSKLQLGKEEKVTGGQIGWVWGMGGSRSCCSWPKTAKL